MYPQQQQQPQGYAPQQPQQQPAPWQMPQQQNPYTQYPQVPPQPQATVMPQPQAAPQMVDPAPRYSGPRIRDIGPGRLVIFKPTKIENVPNTMPDQPPGATQDRITADVAILDGQPFGYGGKPEKHVPHDKMSPVPAQYHGMFISPKGLVAALSKAVAHNMANPHAPQVVVGRLSLGAQSNNTLNPPWQLLPASPADQQAASAYLAWAAQNGIGETAPTAMPQAPQQPQPQYATARPVSAAPQYVPQQPQYAPQPPQQSVHGIVAQAYAPQPAQQPMPQMPTPAPYSAPPAQAPQGPPPNSGITPELWASWSPEQRAPFLAASATPVPAGETPPW